MRHPRARTLPPLLLLLLGVAASAAAQPRGLTPQDAMRLASVGDVVLSPTGAHVAYTVTTVNEQQNTRSTAIWLQALRGGRPDGAAVRFTDPTRNSSAPSWSPDGRVLGFTSRRGDEEGSTWFLRVGGLGGEAYRIEGVRGTPVWSPDGRFIAYTAEPERTEKPDARALRIAPNGITKPLDARRFDGYQITHLRYKRDGTFTFLPHPDLVPKRQLFIVSATGGEARQVTDLPHNVGAFAWAPNGSYLVFSGNPNEDDDLSLDPSSRIWVVPAEGGTATLAVTMSGGVSAPAISPDGSRLAFLHTAAWNAETELHVVDVDARGVARGASRSLTAAWGRTAGAPSWTSDGRALRFTATVGASAHVYEVPAAGGPVRQVTTGDRVLANVSVAADGRLMAYTATSPVAPADVHVADRAGAGEVRLSAVNDALLAQITRQPATRLSWTVRDGTEIEGWVIPPVGHEPGRRYPMVLNIHGGPHSAYTNAFSAGFHTLSASGFFVFYLNPRGSTGYGNAFKHAIQNAWGLVDEEDFITGVETVLRRYPDIDPARLGVMGGSYGGYMTNWLTARTTLFAAAVTRASIASWEAMAGTTDSNQPIRAFDGMYHEQRDTWRTTSPISYVERVTAPTLVIHGENDFRTPLSEGQIWYASLKKLGVPTEFLIYPRSGHGISEPWLAADAQERSRQWMVHWLIERPAATRLPTP
jgi:dipeptidyl aminopeptidase/acylaminoacyl peptidase